MDIYVGNLPFKTDDDGLKALFEEYGHVMSARIITDKFTRQSRGFGFVEMPNNHEAERAIDRINGSDFMGRTLRVNESQRNTGRERRPQKRYEHSYA